MFEVDVRNDGLFLGRCHSGKYAAVAKLAREQGGLVSVSGLGDEVAVLLFGGTDGGELCLCQGEDNLPPEDP